MAPRSHRWLLLALCLAGMPGGPGGARGADDAPPPRVEWGESYYEGYKRAREEGRPICLFFTACWSRRGREIESGALADASVQAALAPYACVKVDMDGDTLTPRRFHVKRVPGILLLDRDEKDLLDGPVTDVTPQGLADALARGCAEFRKRP